MVRYTCSYIVDCTDYLTGGSTISSSSSSLLFGNSAGDLSTRTNRYNGGGGGGGVPRLSQHRRTNHNRQPGIVGGGNTSKRLRRLPVGVPAAVASDRTPASLCCVDDKSRRLQTAGDATSSMDVDSNDDDNDILPASRIHDYNYRGDLLKKHS